jgi:hypothetical protein
MMVRAGLEIPEQNHLLSHCPQNGQVNRRGGRYRWVCSSGRGSRSRIGDGCHIAVATR